MKSNILTFVILTLWFVALSIKVAGHEIQLKDKWLVYDKKAKIYTPLLVDGNNHKVITTNISKKWLGYYLLFESQEGLCLYVNDKFDAYYPTKGKYISVPLRELFLKYKQDTLEITFYQPKGELPVFSKLSDVITFTALDKEKHDSRHRVVSRYYNTNYNSWILCLFTSFVLFLYVKVNYKLMFRDFYTRLLVKNINYSISNTFLLLCIVVSSWNLALQSHFLEDSISLLYYYSLQDWVVPIKWFSIFNWFAVFFLWILLKMIIISVVNSVLDLEIQKIHYYEICRSLFILSIVGVIAIFYTSFSYGYKNYIVFFIEKLPLISFIYITLIVLIQLMKIRYFKLLYLFLYICTTELIPFFIFNKMIYSNT